MRKLCKTIHTKQNQEKTFNLSVYMIQITYKDMYVYTKDYTYVLKAKI